MLGTLLKVGVGILAAIGGIVVVKHVAEHVRMIGYSHPSGRVGIPGWGHEFPWRIPPKGGRPVRVLSWSGD